MDGNASATNNRVQSIPFNFRQAVAKHAVCRRRRWKRANRQLWRRLNSVNENGHLIASRLTRSPFDAPATSHLVLRPAGTSSRLASGSYQRRSLGSSTSRARDAPRGSPLLPPTHEHDEPPHAGRGSRTSALAYAFAVLNWDTVSPASARRFRASTHLRFHSASAASSSAILITSDIKIGGCTKSASHPDQHSVCISFTIIDLDLAESSFSKERHFVVRSQPLTAS